MTNTKNYHDMETEKLNFTKTAEGAYQAAYTTRSDHDVLQASLPENAGMTVYARIPGQEGKTAIGSVGSFAARDVLCELSIPAGMEIIVECGSEGISATIGKGE